MTISSATLALLILVATMKSPATLSAQDEACGDAEKSVSEQCDDGNTASGDGCSSECKVERCGNGIEDFREQCDDGNTASGDGCTEECLIEFCGDTFISAGTGEQCDDGNTSAGDGCSASCRTEGAPKGVTKEESTPKTPTPLPTPRQPVKIPDVIKKDPNPIVRAPVSKQTAAVVTEVRYFSTPEGEKVIDALLGTEDTNALQRLLTDLKKGPLSADQRAEASRIAAVIQATKEASVQSQVGLLESLLQGLIPADVLSLTSLTQSELSLQNLSAIIAALEEKVTPLRGAELDREVASILTHLKGVDAKAFSELPSDIQQDLAGGPKDVLRGLVALKSRLETIATTDLPASLTRVRENALALQESLPLLQAEYGIDADEFARRIDSLIAVADDVTPDTLSRVIAANNRLLADIRRNGGISSEEIASTQGEKKHAAARALRLSEKLGHDGQIVTPGNLEELTENLASNIAPEEKSAFSEGDTKDQAKVLEAILKSSELLISTKQALIEAGNKEVQERYDAIVTDIQNLGSGTETVSPCDDSAAAAMQCIDDYLLFLEATANDRSTLTKAASHIRQFFGIDQ